MNQIRTSAAIAVASGVAVASLALPSAAAASHTAAPVERTLSPSAAAAGFLVRQFDGKHHDHLNGSFESGGKTITFADYGETADAVLSLDAAGVAQRAARRATTFLEANASTYALGGLSAPNYYPGNVAKLLLVAEAQHVNPQKFGSLDLIGILVGSEGAGGASPGQYQNPGDTDFGSSNLIQALAVLALANTVSTASQPDPNAVGFLAGQQCDNGAFQVAIRTDTSTDCKGTDDDVDATAYAIQALIAGGNRSAAAHALHWVQSVENKDGGWGETVGAKSEANSTAIAIEALVAGHRDDAKAMKWLAGQTVGCASPKARWGAVRFQGKYDVATATRATSQAGVALAGKSLTAVDKNGAQPTTRLLFCPVHHKHHKHKHHQQS